ncbi:MAG: DNA/RNA helicase [Hyphomonadaceae bacterium]|nr:hypothetical protein [Aquidulcibacter sp.]
MIEVIGQPGSSEHDAAIRIRDAFLKLWPGVDTSPVEQENIKIVSKLKLSGQKVSDIDVVVAGLLRTKRYIIPRSNAKDVDGKSIIGTKVRVTSFVIAVEVKDHSADGVKAEAGSVTVRYKDGWKSATDQNEDQRYALVGQLRDVTGVNVWVYRCLVLLGLHELPQVRGIPQPAAGAVPALFDIGRFLMAAASVNGIRKLGHEHVIASAKDEIMEQVLEDGLFRALMPSGLDRKRMDRIAARPQEAKELGALIGLQRVHLRGHGGTGKTVLLLQAAYEAFLERGIRSLVLTYNTALAADIQRTIALMGIPSEGEAGGITVKTVMAFMFSWLDRLGMGSESQINLQNYDEKCREALEFISKGAIGQQEIEEIKRNGPFQFGYDAILIDEAQDWPQAEADLLVKLYGGNTISLADGFSQLVRGQPTDWKSSVFGQPKSGDRSLRDGLRMKANLCRFANSLAEEAGLQWKVTPNSAAPGGRIIVRIGNYAEMRDLQREVLASAIKSKNMPIDLLHCVPPSAVQQDGETRTSELARSFDALGWASWDAVDDKVRKAFPRSVDSFRVVQYESCRGLEGWVTVLDGLDEFWELKRVEGRMSLPSEQTLSDELLDSYAWRWAMIPITRPIDTLVITLRDTQSHVAQLLAGLARQLPDIVEFS